MPICRFHSECTWPDELRRYANEGRIVDSSEKDDVCGSIEFWVGKWQYRVWCDYPEPERREYPEGPRFNVLRYAKGLDPDTDDISDALQSATEVLKCETEEELALKFKRLAAKAPINCARFWCVGDGDPGAYQAIYPAPRVYMSVVPPTEAEEEIARQLAIDGPSLEEPGFDDNVTYRFVGMGTVPGAGGPMMKCYVFIPASF